MLSDFSYDNSMLEDLRQKIYEIEKKLIDFNFDPHRGIETYKPSEIKVLLRKSKQSSELIRLLKEAITLQTEFYRRLYLLTNTKNIDVDTDSPEKNILRIRNVLEHDARDQSSIIKIPKSKKVISAIKEILGESKDSERCFNEIIHIIKKEYKRDYDRFRVLELLLSEMGCNVAKSTLCEYVRLLIDLFSKENKEGRLGISNRGELS